jgi:hypothetical protein
MKKPETNENARAVDSTLDDTPRVDITPINSEEELLARLREKGSDSPYVQEPMLDDILCYRPHVNVMLAPSIAPHLQDGVPASPYELRELIETNLEIQEYFEHVCDGKIYYSGKPEGCMMPYFMPTAILFEPWNFVKEQIYFYLMRVDVGGINLAPGEKYFIDRGDSESWRDYLFLMFPNHVRMAYVAPSQDAVYLLCQGKLEAGQGRIYVEDQIRKEQDNMKRLIEAVRIPKKLNEDIQVHACEWGYLAFDPDVKWRTTIKSLEIGGLKLKVES